MDTEIHSSSRWHTDIYAHDATATLLSITSLTDRQTLFEPCGWVLRYKLAGPEGWERVWSCCGAFRRLSSLRSLSHIHVLPCKYIPATKGQHWALGCSLEHNSLARGIQPSLPVFWGVPSSLLLDTACLGRYRLPRFPWYGAWYGIFPWGCFQWEGCKGWTTQPASAPKQTTWCRAWGLISCRTSVAGRAAWGGGAFVIAFVSGGSPRPGWALPDLLPSETQPVSGWAFAALEWLRIRKGALGASAWRGSALLPSRACLGLGETSTRAPWQYAESRRARSALLRPPRAKPRRGRGRGGIRDHRADRTAGVRLRAPWVARAQTPAGREECANARCFLFRLISRCLASRGLWE